MRFYIYDFGQDAAVNAFIGQMSGFNFKAS